MKANITNQVTELLIYAAAMDLYRKMNLREVWLSEHLRCNLLEVVAWEARPKCLPR